MDFETMTEVNDYLVMIFNEVLSIEEEALSQSEFSNLSIKKMHTIEAIGLSGDLSSNEVAKKLGVTAGTLSVSIQNLVKKNYDERVQSPEDRRVVKLKLSKSCQLIYRLQRKFHMDIVKETLEDLNTDEAAVLIKSLKNLHQFLLNKKVAGRK